MRIVFVQAGLGPGGAEKVVNLLAHHRAHLGDEVHVLSLTGRNSSSYFPYDASIGLRSMSPDRQKGSSVIRLAKSVWWLRRQLLDLQPAIVISFLTKVNVMTALAGIGLRIPILISERNNPQRQAANRLWIPIAALTANLATRLVMQTDGARHALPRRLKAKSTVIGNPSQPPANVGTSANGGKRLVAVGRLEAQKGFDLLLEAFERIARRHTGSTLTIFGEGVDRRALESLSKQLGIAGQVKFAGVTATPGAWIGEADVFVLSSRYEGFPNALLEALGAGLPVVAFDCPWGPSSMIKSGENGLLVPAENTTALAAALNRLLGDSDLKRRLADAAPDAARRFSIDKVMEDWDRVIHEATGSAEQRVEP